MNKELKENIMQGTLQAFNQKGLKFTMDDIAKILGISKKTIYQVFRDKETLFLETVDYLFDRIKDSEQKIVENPEMDTLQKIHTILGVMPECYQDADFRQLYQLKEKYPEIYHQVEVRLETGWETTIALLEQGMQEGVIRPVQIPILKMMLEAVFSARDPAAEGNYLCAGIAGGCRESDVWNCFGEVKRKGSIKKHGEVVLEQ